MKKNILVILVFVTVNCYAQSIKDSIGFHIESAKNRLDKVKNNDDKSRICLELDYLYDSKGLFDSSYFYANLAYGYSKNTYDLNLIYKASRSFGGLNRYIGNYNEAINVYIDAVERLKGKNDTLAFYLMNEVQITYRRAKDYKNQLIYAFKTKEIGDKVGNLNKTFVGTTYTGIGDAYQNLNILDSALYYFNKDYELSLMSGVELSTKFMAIANIGEVNLKLGEVEIALTYLRKASLMMTQAQDAYKSELYREISKCYYMLQQKDSSIFYGIESFKMAKRTFNNFDASETANHLTKLFADYKMKDSTFKYRNIYIDIQDSLYNNDKIRNLELATINEKIRQLKISEEKLKAIKEREQNLILAAIGFFIPVFTTVVFFISKWSKKKSKIIISLGIASLLMLFEFISLLIHPYVEKYTDHNIALMYIILLIIASALVPLHHKMEEFVKKNFSQQSKN